MHFCLPIMLHYLSFSIWSILWAYKYPLELRVHCTHYLFLFSGLCLHKYMKDLIRVCTQFITIRHWGKPVKTRGTSKWHVLLIALWSCSFTQFAMLCTFLHSTQQGVMWSSVKQLIENDFLSICSTSLNLHYHINVKKDNWTSLVWRI